MARRTLRHREVKRLEMLERKLKHLGVLVEEYKNNLDGKAPLLTIWDECSEREIGRFALDSSPEDLLRIIAISRERFNAGYDAGKEAMKSDFRKLLDINGGI